MNPVQFKEMNVIYKAEGYQDLPAKQEIDGVISCWTPSLEELNYIQECIINNETPKIYLVISGDIQPPVYVGCNIFEPDKIIS